MSEAKKKTRISLDLSQTALDRLTELELLTDSDSKADLIRDALRLYEFLVKESLKGSEIQCVSPQGKVTVLGNSLPSPIRENSLLPAQHSRSVL